MARFIHSFCEQEGLPHLDKSAMARIIEYTSRLAGDNKKLSTRFNDISQVVAEAGTWAQLSKSKIITKEFVEKALIERIKNVINEEGKVEDVEEWGIKRLAYKIQNKYREGYYPDSVP